jgi:hypothetical protein
MKANEYALQCEGSFLALSTYAGIQRVATAEKATKFGALQVQKLESLLGLLPDGTRIVQVPQ